MLAAVRFCVPFAILASAVASSAATVTIDFEGIPDSTSIGSTYAASGITFVNAQVITAGISLNELEFPPHSGQNVATDAGGPITLDFSSTVYSFSGYFTYTSALDLAAFDASNNQVGEIMSLFSNNFVSSGNAPNEFIQLSSASGFTSLTITGDPAGGSFVMDDITFQTGSPVTGGNSPEPGSVWLLLTGSFAVVAGLRRSLRKR